MKNIRLQFENWPQWFAAIWPNAQRRWLVLNQYRALGTLSQAMLADIAIRNNVFSPIRENDAHLAAIAEGRRQCALEIFKLSRVDAEKLFEQTQNLRTNQGNRT